MTLPATVTLHLDEAHVATLLAALDQTNQTQLATEIRAQLATRRDDSLAVAAGAISTIARALAAECGRYVRRCRRDVRCMVLVQWAIQTHQQTAA
jgi:hypothetical protein